LNKLNHFNSALLKISLTQVEQLTQWKNKSRRRRRRRRRRRKVMV